MSRPQAPAKVVRLSKPRLDAVDITNGANPSLYLGHSLEFLTSAAWRGAPDDCRRVLDRLEVEHLRQRLKANGKLLCTYDDFVAWGVRRAAVRLAIEQAVALGFVEITRRGFPARAMAPIPSLYRLTYAKAYKDIPPETNDWRRLATAEDVRIELKVALARLEDERAFRRQRRQNQSSAEKKNNITLAADINVAASRERQHG